MLLEIRLLRVVGPNERWPSLLSVEREGLQDCGADCGRDSSSHLPVPVWSTAKGGPLLSLLFGTVGHLSILSVSQQLRLEASLEKRCPGIWVRNFEYDL